MDESILTSIKEMLGISEDDTAYDTDVITDINAVLMILTQVGVGPEEGFTVTDKDDTWDDFIDEEHFVKFASIKTYVYMKVKLIFDPPLNSAVTASMEKLISEFECRLNYAAENN